MRNKIIAAAVAGGLLVGAGFLTTVVSAPSVASAQEETDEAQGHGFFRRGLDILSEVLSDLVSDGTIDQSQADAVTDGVQAKAEEIKIEREALHELIKSFLEDGVITAAEAAQLPEDHPFNGDAFDEAWEDGELTMEEIREARPHPRRHAFKRGARFGALLDDGGIDAAEWGSLVAELPEDHPLGQVDVSGYLIDDVITIEELREIHEGLKDSYADNTSA